GRGAPRAGCPAADLQRRLHSQCRMARDRAPQRKLSGRHLHGHRARGAGRDGGELDRRLHARAGDVELVHDLARVVHDELDAARLARRRREADVVLALGDLDRGGCRRAPGGDRCDCGTGERERHGDPECDERRPLAVCVHVHSYAVPRPAVSYAAALSAPATGSSAARTMATWWPRRHRKTASSRSRSSRPAKVEAERPTAVSTPRQTSQTAVKAVAPREIESTCDGSLIRRPDRRTWRSASGTRA